MLRIDWLSAAGRFFVPAFLVLLLSLSQPGARVSGAARQHIPDMLISIELRHVLLRDALNKIGDIAHLSFVYVSNKALDKNKVSITAHREKIGKVLDNLLRPYALNYTVVDNRVIVWRNAGKIAK